MSNVIICENIHKKYYDGSRVLHILRGVNLEVPEGKILAISGPSGVGKSTLLHIIGTLDSPTEGRIVIGGRDVQKLSRMEINQLRNKDIGFVFQFYHLLPEFTALENVMMPALCKGKRKGECSERAEELLCKVGLKERMTHKPGELSGGEQQRVAIARALFNEPRVVLTDEPTGNLDEETSSGVIDLLWKLNEDENITLVVVTHDDSLAQKAHHWVHLHEGQTYIKK
ncbi:MAG TPA: ABC transporter ATP-binding protein [Candidatus Hydrogenedens sp.]|nr:ABC transporter ATP-binding protein [Candidatus Hydrogenedens sp.]HOK09823.1 ABC transporter ATP-binding protein [Candidatus Hydrogenedens sp.]HOL19480.1 ABC transporter ATP-binding protein [Candidatus Hydrogenedens sp.]HPP59416.1 ABC transporter ATP-binding protein [Candidatus Hydrogenedens sp.]